MVELNFTLFKLVTCVSSFNTSFTIQKCLNIHFFYEF
ncbi:putative signal peptide protein [Puccinia sorghi]|uniref:Putative signal peptide protein n=1 Tax=Puccinia sorghi TaxID=27349 RepID=A0A0L6USZ7_9BASI|nr:putative signal peptide protein [Puccinia sorghi]